MMEYNQYITPDNKVYTFDSNVDKFLYSIEGEGMPALDLITQQGPYQHGMTVLDYRLRSRTIQLIHKRVECGRGAYWDARSNLLDFLRPNRQSAFGSYTLGKLRKFLPGGDRRDIDVMIQNGPRYVGRNLDNWEETTISEAIIFIAPDPTYYNPTAATTLWVLGAQDHLVFPIEILPSGPDFVFGTSIINNSVSITYTGTWFTYPTITIHGPITGPIIENLSTGEMIHLLYAIASDEIVTIGLQYGNKYVENDDGINLVGVASYDSDLSTFHIATDPEVTGGINVLRVIGTDVDANTTIQVSYYTRYIGI